MYEPYNFTYIDQNLCLVLNSTNSDGKLSQRWRTASVRTQTLGAIPVFLEPLTGQCTGMAPICRKPRMLFGEVGGGVGLGKKKENKNYKELHGKKCQNQRK